jgi:glycosyltransferase involved in cell wall biosynthesis
MMRIIYSHRIQSHDGQGVHVEAMVAALRAIGHEVQVVGPGFYRAVSFGGESRLVPMLRRFLPGIAGEFAELAYNLPAYLRLRRACRVFRPDLIYERYNLFHVAGALLARRRRVPFYVEVNAPLAAERARYGTLRLRRLAGWAERLVWTAAVRVLAVTGVLRDIVIAAGVAPERVVVTPNGIDPARFTDLPAPSGDGLVLGFVGFVRSWHGLDQVIAALAAEPAAHATRPALRLVVVGDGPARAELQAQAHALGLDQVVTFSGLALPEASPGLVGGFDIALQPRSVAYASPLKIFEYMAAGRAIVAPDQPNIREILQHERTALLFDPDRPGALWQAICRLADDPALRTRLGQAARDELRARDYTWTHNAAILTELHEYSSE